MKESGEKVGDLGEITDEIHTFLHQFDEFE